VRKEQFSSQLGVKLSDVPLEPFKQFVGDRLSAELTDEFVVIDFASHFPWCDDHFFFIGHGEPSLVEVFS